MKTALTMSINLRKAKREKNKFAIEHHKLLETHITSFLRPALTQTYLIAHTMDDPSNQSIMNYIKANHIEEQKDVEGEMLLALQNAKNITCTIFVRYDK